MDRIYRDWDKPLSENDAEGLLKLYAEDPIIESPLIPHLLGKEEVVCRGYKEMRPFFEAVAKWQNESLHFVSISELAIYIYLSDGNKKVMFGFRAPLRTGNKWISSEVM